MSVGKTLKNKKYPNTQKDITFYEIGQDHKLCSCASITGTFTDCIFCFLVKLNVKHHITLFFSQNGYVEFGKVAFQHFLVNQKHLSLLSFYFVTTSSRHFRVFFRN